MKWKKVEERNAFIRRTIWVEADTEEAAEDAVQNGDWLDVEDEILKLDGAGYESIENLPDSI
jgi:hypothetical protein